MPLTAAQVREASFRVVLRGYAVAEVDAFLERVEQELTRLLGEEAGNGAPPAAASRCAAPEPTSEARPPEDVEPPRARALGVLELAERALTESEADARRVRQAAQDEADQLRRDAEAAVAELLEDAQAQADAVLLAARERALQAEAEVELLRAAECEEVERRCREARAELARLQLQEQTQRDDLTRLLREHLRLVERTVPAAAVPPAAVPAAAS